MKNALLQKFLKDQELDEYYQLSHRSDEESRRYIFVCLFMCQREKKRGRCRIVALHTCMT